MDPENFDLTRNDFEVCAKNAFRSLFSNQEFSDVTLSCTGNKHIKTHKVVLSACSPFFREILLQNPNPSPLIYLKGIDFKDLEAIVKYMYLGHTSVAESRLESFLASSQELEVEGLLLGNDEEKSKASRSGFQSDESRNDTTEETSKYSSEQTSNYSDVGIIDRENPTSFEQSTYDVSRTKESFTPRLGSDKFKCDQCDFETLYRKNLKRHTDRVHEVRVLNKAHADVKPEPIRENIVSIKKAVAGNYNNQSFEHPAANSRKANEEVFQCDSCEFISKHKWNMKRHKENVHAEHLSKSEEMYRKGIALKTERKDFLNTSDPLNYNHEQFPSLHQTSTPFSSSQIDNTGANVADLKRKCSHCDFETMWKRNLKRHIQRVHPVAALALRNQSCS